MKYKIKNYGYIDMAQDSTHVTHKFLVGYINERQEFEIIQGYTEKNEAVAHIKRAMRQEFDAYYSAKNEVKK